MHTIRLKAADSRIATAEELDEAKIAPEHYPKGWRQIMAHQAATVRALRFGTAPIIINQAMTGDGKSFAGQFMLFNEANWRTFIMYPTNELAADQNRSLQKLLADWTPLQGLPDIQPVNAAKIDQIQTRLESSRMEALDELVPGDLLLTNPDIFHLIMQFAYTQYGTTPDWMLGKVSRRYRLFVFDEFHLFGAAQSAAVMIALLLIKTITAPERPSRFLFLSATPQRTLETLAAKAELPIEIISGSYCATDGSLPPEDGWRRILQSVELTLHEGRLEEWVREHLEDVILAFFKHHRPGAKGVIIANSVATAHRIYDLLLPVGQTNGIRVEANTGLIPPSQRGRDFDLLVATSTVDVGVDFRINLLIFESPDANTHFQRLGRLGRHEQDNQGNTFERFEAHALLPEWVIKSVMDKFPVGASVSRKDYEDVVRAAMTEPQQFELYPRKWAGIQAGHVLSQLRIPVIRSQYEAYTPVLRDVYWKLFGGSLNRFRAVRDEQPTIFDAVRSFRGSSSFTALVLDVSPLRETSEVQSYNLVSLLLRGDLEAVEIDDLLQLAINQGKDVRTLKRGNPLAAYKLRGWRDKAREISIVYGQELPAEREVVTECQSIRLHVPDNAGVGLAKLNDKLSARTLATFFIPNQDHYTVRRMLKLGMQIELFAFTSLDNVQGCVAFGQDALLLDSAWRRQKNRAADHPFIL